MSTEDEFDSFKGFFQAYGEDAADPSQLAQVSTFDGLYLNIVSSPFQFCGEEIAKFPSFNTQNSPLVEADEEKKSYAFPSASLEILRACSSRNRLSNEVEEKASPPLEISINHLIKLSAANFIRPKLVYAISHPYADAFLGLSEENARDVHLVQDLLSSTEKVNNHQFESASRLLEECHNQSFKQMSKTQRLVYYFTQALFV